MGSDEKQKYKAMSKDNLTKVKLIGKKRVKAKKVESEDSDEPTHEGPSESELQIKATMSKAAQIKLKKVMKLLNL